MTTTDEAPYSNVGWVCGCGDVWAINFTPCPREADKIYFTMWHGSKGVQRDWFNAHAPNDVILDVLLEHIQTNMDSGCSWAVKLPSRASVLRW